MIISHLFLRPKKLCSVRFVAKKTVSTGRTQNPGEKRGPAGALRGRLFEKPGKGMIGPDWPGRVLETV